MNRDLLCSLFLLLAGMTAPAAAQSSTADEPAASPLPQALPPQGQPERSGAAGSVLPPTLLEQPPVPGPDAGAPVPPPPPGVDIVPATRMPGDGCMGLWTCLNCPPDGQACHFWVNGEYLLWWIKSNPLPPILTTGSVSDAIPGALGQPGTQVLFGGTVDNEERSGGRFRAGVWLNDAHTFGLDGSFLFLGSRSANYEVHSNGGALLARPFSDPLTNQQEAFLTAYPGVEAGRLMASLTSQVWGAESNLRSAVLRRANGQLSLLAGFRYFSLDESLDIQESSILLSPTDPSVDRFTDRFHTRNNFYGGQIGADLALYRSRLSVDLVGKIAFGATVEQTNISGSSTYNTLAGSTTLPVGVLAQPSNVGWYRQGSFAVLPEGTVTVGYAVTNHFRLTAGYTFLYLNRVFRPGDQIDTVINPTQVVALATGTQAPGPARPNFTWKESDFWAQGLNFGLEFRY